MAYLWSSLDPTARSGLHSLSWADAASAPVKQFKEEGGDSEAMDAWGYWWQCLSAPACKPSFCVSKSSAQCGYISPDKLQMELFHLVGEITWDIKMTFFNLLACQDVVRDHNWGCRSLRCKHAWRDATLTPTGTFILLVCRFGFFWEKLHFEHKRPKAWRCLENLGQEAWIWITPLQRAKRSPVGKMYSPGTPGPPWLPQISSLSFRNLLWLWVSPQKGRGRKGQLKTSTQYH